MKSQIPQQYSIKDDAKESAQSEKSSLRASNGNIPEKEENYYSDWKWKQIEDICARLWCLIGCQMWTQLGEFGQT